MFRRKEGATIAQIVEATGWQPHYADDQQQPQGIPIRAERVRADLPLTDEAIGEERLQGRGKCGHASPPR
jgi:hypothetical protein